MTRSGSDVARRHLDARLRSLRGNENYAQPQKGWIRAIRDALGMTGAELGRRVGVSQAQLSQFEQGEVNGSITLRSLRNVAEALECELVYALVSRRPFDDILRAKAQSVAERQLRATHHSMALENQAMRSADLAVERDRLVAALLDDPRQIWKAE